MVDVVNPVPVWLDGLGQLMTGGKIYIGVAGSDPEVLANQLQLYFPGNIPASQPIRTLGGFSVNDSNARTSFRFPAGTDSYSIRVRDINDVQIYYLANVPVSGAEFQPADDELTALAALTTTAFGRGLLTLTNAAALDSATGRPASLPAGGGPVTGNITRQSAGTYLYTSGGTVGKVIVLASGSGTNTDDCAIVGYY